MGEGSVTTVDSFDLGPLVAGKITAGMGTSALCRLTLPYERPPESLVGNARTHWRGRSRDTQAVRATVLVLARQAGLQRLDNVERVTVRLTWAPGDRIRRDADNLWPMLKVCCDALARGPRRDWVGLDLVPDDTPAYMEKLAPVIEPPPAKGMWLDLLLDFHEAA